MEPLLTMDELGLRTDAYFITTEKYIEDNKELLTNYLKAFQETQDWVLENQEEVAKIVEEKQDSAGSVFRESETGKTADGIFTGYEGASE